LGLHPPAPVTRVSLFAGATSTFAARFGIIGIALPHDDGSLAEPIRTQIPVLGRNGLLDLIAR
jgi:hypothetical protein